MWPRDPRPGLRVRACAVVGLAALLAGCPVPYPAFVSAGGFVVPPSAQKEPLDANGARVQVVAYPPPGCLFLGLATGVGGARDAYVPTGDAYLPRYQAEAVVALRNVVGAIGGTHTVVDAEVQVSGRRGVEAVVLRGAALRCPSGPDRARVSLRGRQAWPGVRRRL